MSTRPYTAIMVSNGCTLGVQGNYDYDPVKACQDIELSHTGWHVVALVPGYHMSGAELFPRERLPPAAKEIKVDVWDIPGGMIPPYKIPNCS